MRGFAAALISICTFFACFFSYLIPFIALAYEALNDSLEKNIGFRITSKTNAEEEEEKKKRVENTYDKANKINSFRDDFYAITFVGYIYLTIEQRKELILNSESDLKVEDKNLSKQEAEKTLLEMKRIKREEFFKDPITEEARVLTDSEVARNFMNCIFICLMQLTMTIATIKYFNKPAEGANKNADPLFITYVVRLMCALALHMQIEPEVFQGLQMIKFALFRCNNPRLRFFQICVAVMQLSGAIFTEYINILLICEQDEVKNIVMNFIQFAAIA